MSPSETLEPTAASQASFFMAQMRPPLTTGEVEDLPWGVFERSSSQAHLIHVVAGPSAEVRARQLVETLSRDGQAQPVCTVVGDPDGFGMDCPAGDPSGVSSGSFHPAAWLLRFPL